MQVDCTLTCLVRTPRASDLTFLLLQAQQDTGLSRLKAIWQAMMKGNRTAIIGRWRSNVYTHRMRTLHAHIAVQV